MSMIFEEMRLQVLNDINQQSLNTLNTLTKIWKETFDDDLCSVNVGKLSEHVKTFYNEIIDETKSRKEKIKLELNHLYAEAIHLKKVLKVDINLTPEQDVPLYSMHRHLTECLQILREQLEHRKGKVDILLEEQKILCSDLGEYPKELEIDSSVPTDNELIEFRQYLDNLIIEKHNRLNESNKIRIDIEILLMKLDISLDDNTLNDPSLPLTKQNISKLYIIRTDLQNRYNDLREDIDKMKTKLENLWNVFDLDDSITKQFDDIEYNQENYTKISRALEYWEQERRSNIRQFVSKARDELSYWWNKNLYSESEKANNSIFDSNCFTEELLASHELEIKYLKDFYYEHEKMFNLIEERQHLWQRMQEIAGRAREPGRYTNRGGQLLKEEKDRKMISKNLPAIEIEILALAEIYQKSSNKPFTVYGIPVAELIDQDWAKMNDYKEEIKFTRKKTADSTPAKPIKLKRQVSTVKKAMKSVSSMATTSGTNENRFHMPKHLLKDIPTRKNLATKVTKLTYTSENRRSLKLRKSKDRRVSGGRVTKTHVQINNSAGTDSVNYDTFKDYITPRSPCRSSMVSPNDKLTKTITMKRTPLTPIPGTPTSARKLYTNKSPSASRTATPRSTPSSVRKFSTINLPILI